MLAPGDIVGEKYRITRLIGEGGMGSVFEARHLVLGTGVALKFLHPELADKPNLKQRFLQEARLSASIIDPHIVRVLDVDSAPQGPYLVMELLGGKSLVSIVQREAPLALAQAIDFTLQLLAGLEVAHAAHVVHRDLKPDNVFVTVSRGRPLLKLLDFGIAKLRDTEEFQMTLTRPGAVMGTPEYMAPEQAFSADLVDERSDIYSLGVMMFEMLSGNVPATGETAQQIAELILNGKRLRLDQVRPDLPRSMVELVHRAMAPRPEHRFRTVGELRLALHAVAQELGLPLEGAELERASAAPAPNSPLSAHTHVTAPDRMPAGDGLVFSTTEPGLAQASTVAKTVPPATDQPPPVSALLGQTNRTASMPQMAAKTNPTALKGTRTSARKKGGATAWVLTALALLGAVGGSIAAYENYVKERPVPPPQPTRREISSAPVTVVDVPEPEASEVEKTPTRYAPGPSPTPNPGRGAGTFPPIPTALPPELAGLPGALASAIPTTLPTAIPTTFPTALPTLPAVPTQEPKSSGGASP